MNATVILSGGQDSTFCLGRTVQEYGAENVAAVTFDYGQRHHVELQAASLVAQFYGVEHTIITLPGGILESTSPLVSDNRLHQYADFQAMEDQVGNRVEDTFVPMRNDLFLTLAANRAVAKGHREVVTGVCGNDTANYPDCRPSFIHAKQGATREALGTQNFYITTPVLHHTKSSMIEEARAVPGVYQAWALSHTAYDGQYPPTGSDHATLLRAEGFRQAGVPDPLVARAHYEGLMELPLEVHYDHVPGPGSVWGLAKSMGFALLEDANVRE